MPAKSTISRRQFLSLLLTALPGASIAHGITIEPERLRISRNTLKIAGPAVRFVHFSDLHFRGETVLTRKVADEICRFTPHFACFTGDLIDNADNREGAFAFIHSLSCPVYGVPGNHDYLSGVPFKEFVAAFSSTGGAWLENENLLIPGTGLEVVGLAINGNQTIPPPLSEKRIMLTHFPQAVDKIGDATFAVILAGHSHGGQVRLPFYGSLYLPTGVGQYDLGSFQTPAGPLHVTAGIGTSALPVRFCCPPELSLYQS
jgi:predicted MPP superfamily phosphohydrolase